MGWEECLGRAGMRGILRSPASRRVGAGPGTSRLGTDADVNLLHGTLERLGLWCPMWTRGAQGQSDGDDAAVASATPSGAARGACWLSRRRGRVQRGGCPCGAVAACTTLAAGGARGATGPAAALLPFRDKMASCGAA